MKHNPDDYERTVYGLGYQIGCGGSRDYPKIYTHWRDMLQRIMLHGNRYNTLNLAKSWECFENFRDWFLIEEKDLRPAYASRYLVFLAPEFLPKRMKVGDKIEMIVSPKFGPKTCTLKLKKPPTYRKPYTREMRVRNEVTEIVEDVLVERKGTPNAQRTMFDVPVDTKLYRRKVAIVRSEAAAYHAEEARREVACRERAALDAKKDVERIGRLNTNRGVTAEFNRVVLPAQELQRKQLAKAKSQEASRLVGLDDVEARIKQRGIYRGLGYIGEGPHETRLSTTKTRAYNRWMWLLNRCYKNVDRREDTNMYLGYRLGKKFLCFQDFAKWFEKHDRPGAPLPTFIVKPNSKNKLVLGPKNTTLMF